MATTSTSSAVQIHEPRRWPRAVSCMRWTNTRPIRPSVIQNAAMLSRGHMSGGAESVDVQIWKARARAIRNAWHGKAMRKNCAAQAVSCDGSTKAPVTGCIAMLAAAVRSPPAPPRGPSITLCCLSLDTLQTARVRSVSPTRRGGAGSAAGAAGRLRADEAVEHRRGGVRRLVGAGVAADAAAVPAAHRRRRPGHGAAGG
eukprot:scaffold133288_cov78-Phaeocystis_antarctica.AAC.5